MKRPKLKDLTPIKPRVRLSDFIHGKRVAIVGGARSIRGSRLGKKIDSYDTVVRINCHWPCSFHFDRSLKTDWTEDIGYRTDVLGLALVMFNPTAIRRMRPKLIVTGGSRLNEVTYNEGSHTPVTRGYVENLFRKQIEHGVGRTNRLLEGRDPAEVEEWSLPDDERVKYRLRQWEKFTRYIKSTYAPWHSFDRWPPGDWNPSTGGRMLVNIWKYEPKEFFIAGFDFCTKDWSYTASVHDYQKDGEFALMISKDPRVELSEPTRKSLSSLKVYI